MLVQSCWFVHFIVTEEPSGAQGRSVDKCVHDGAVPPPAPSHAIACRPGCAACCIAPSISSAIPGMPNGKPAGVACVQLDVRLRCRLFGRPERPVVCATLRPSREMCGDTREHALRWLSKIEWQTRPG